MLAPSSTKRDAHPADLIGPLVPHPVSVVAKAPDRLDDVVATLVVPHVEIGVGFLNPTGPAVTLFARGERQRDAGIAPEPRAARLLLIGMRAASPASVR